MDKAVDTYVLVKGSQRTIECALCSDGSMPAKEFIHGLGEDVQRKLDVLFRRMADTGRIFNEQQFKHLEGTKLYEFKRDQVRVGCFQIGNRWILTHGFVKKKDKWPKHEIERAKRIMTEHLAREASRAGRR
jgi:phage-related protein